MTDILHTIVARKHAEVAQAMQQLPLPQLQARLRQAPPVRGFAAAIAGHAAEGKPAVIAEVKKASPSQGVIRSDFDPVAIARSYAAAGAACLSVLTDVDFFQGCDAYLQQARSACALPVLRKDFIVDAYQLVQSRVLGADAILLIAAALGDAQLADFAAQARDLGMDVLLEVHDADELQRALRLPGHVLIGINNRDLRSFAVSLDTTLRLRAMIPEGRIVVSESGIATPHDVHMLRQSGVPAFLVGESFMRADDPGVELQRLFFDAMA